MPALRRIMDGAMLLFLAAWAAIAGLSWLTGWAYWSRRPLAPPA